MFAALREILDFIIMLVQFVVMMIEGLINLIIMIPRGMAFLMETIFSLPFPFVPFASATITVSIIFLLVGRKTQSGG